MAFAVQIDRSSSDEEEEYAGWWINTNTVTKKMQQLCRTLELVSNNSPIAMRATYSLIRTQIILQTNDERARGNIRKRAQSMWRERISCLSQNYRNVIYVNVINLVRRVMSSDTEVFNERKYKDMGETVSYVIAPLENVKAPKNINEILNFTMHLLNFKNSNTHGRTEYHALRCDVMTGSLYCPLGDDNEIIKEIVGGSSTSTITELEQQDLIMNCHKCLFKTIYLKSILLRTDNDSDMKTYWCRMFMESTYFQDQYMQLLRSFCIINTIKERYSFYPSFNITHTVVQEMDKFIGKVINDLPNHLLKKIFFRITERSQNIGYYWAYAKSYFVYKAQVHGLYYLIQKNYSSLHIRDSMGDLSHGGNRNENFIRKAEFKKFATESSIHNQQAVLKWGEAEDVLAVHFITAVQSLQAAFQDDKNVVNTTFLHEAEICRKSCSPDVIITAYNRNNNIILCGRMLTTAPWSQIVSNGAICYYLNELIDRKPEVLTFVHGKFISILLSSLITSIEVSIREWGCPKVALVTRAALTLLGGVRRLSPNSHTYQIVTNVTTIHPLLRVCGIVLQSVQMSLSAGHMTTLGALVKAVPHLMIERVIIGQPDAPPLDGLFNEAITSLYENRHPSIKLLGFTLLRELSKPFVVDDNQKILSWGAEQTEARQELNIRYDHIDTAPTLSVVAFEPGMIYLQQIMTYILSGIRSCEGTYDSVPYSIHHSQILGYLMLSIALYEHCDLARGDIVHHYIKNFKRNRYAEHWMENSLRLIPADIINYALDERGEVPEQYSLYFPNTIKISVEEAGYATTIKSLACRCLYGTLGGVGLEHARLWWLRTPRWKYTAVLKLVDAFVSKPLRDKEFDDIKRRAHLLPGTQIYTVKGVISEAHCKVRVRNRWKRLRISYYYGHPLDAPHAAPSVNPPNTLWLSSYFREQVKSASLFTALEMWICAARAQFESMPKCFICYCVRHVLNGTLPSKFCYRCMNPFHERCLRLKRCTICR